MLPHGDGLGNSVDVVVLVFGTVVHSACESVQTAVMVRVLGLWGNLRLYWTGAPTLSQTQEGKMMYTLQPLKIVCVDNLSVTHVFFSAVLTK